MEVRKEDQRDQDEKVVEIEIERLRDFKNHPFKVQADSQMKELQESIKKYGILNPLIVRPRPEGFYEIISGHRRKYAAQQLKYTKVPVIIRYMLDEDAIISMIDANLQRERISPSEKAFAYKMKYDVLKRKAGRRKCSQVDYLTGKKSVEVISEECGDSPKQVQRYLKLGLLRQIGIEISYIQRDLITVIFYYQISLKPLKTLSLSQVSFPLLFPLYYIVP